ncbi:MAG: cytochrome c [Acidobacteriaceae bacterium]
MSFILRGTLVGMCGILCGCAAKPPGRAETALATSLKHHLVGNKKQRSPLQPTAENIAAGREAFSHYCVACHGLDGQNTGVPFANNMSPPVPSLASVGVQSYTDGQLKSIVTNGIRPSGMPAAKGILNEDEIWAIVLYIRHLPAAGSLGEPCIYSGAETDCKAHDGQGAR